MEKHDGLYSETDLLDCVYADIKKNNEMKQNSRLAMRRPEVSRANKRTMVSNFRDICSRLNRPELDVKAFFDSELSLKKDSSIDANGVLIIVGKFFDGGIVKILTEYINIYVLCKQCSSSNTELIKENRLLMIDCKDCLSKRSV